MVSINWEVDEHGTLYFNPAAISTQLLRKANRDHVAVYVRIPDGIVPLVSFDWAEEAIDHDQLDRLDILQNAFRGFILGGAKGYLYPLADVSLPGDPAFTDSVLRTLAGTKS